METNNSIEDIEAIREKLIGKQVEIISKYTNSIITITDVIIEKIFYRNYYKIIFGTEIIMTGFNYVYIIMTPNILTDRSRINNLINNEIVYFGGIEKISRYGIKLM